MAGLSALAEARQLSDGSIWPRNGWLKGKRGAVAPNSKPNRPMSFAAVLLTPFLLLFPATGAIAARYLYVVPALRLGDNPAARGNAPAGARPQPWQSWVFSEVAESFRVQAQNQVRIEQHMTIRITPARPNRLPPNYLLNLPQRQLAPRMVERNMGRCLPVSGIAGVQPDGNRLILFMRDRRMISATLERACRAQDYYSGFYVDRNDDGQLCVNRDTLLSRSGANCRLTRIRQLVDADD
jgi:hypothetical protein